MYPQTKKILRGICQRPPIGDGERRGKSIPQICKKVKEEVGDQAHPPQDFLPAKHLQLNLKILSF